MNEHREEIPPAAARLALVAIVVGTTLVSLDATIVNVALPAIGASLDVDEGVEWIITANLLGIAAAQPATAWLAERYGHRSVLLTSLAIFTLASLGCSAAPSLGVLVACRALQGLGGGAVIPVSMAVVFEIFPEGMRGRAVSTWGMAGMIVPAFGPTLGGWLVTVLSWRWLFVINLPIGIAAIVVCRRFLPRLPPAPVRRRLDVLGLGLAAGGLTLVVLGISQGDAWGWASSATIVCVAAGLAALTWFAVRSLRIPDPILAVSLLGAPTLRLVLTLLFMLQAGRFAVLTFTPIALAEVRDYSALRIGLILAPAAVMAAVGMKIGGRMVDRVGVRRPSVLGLGVMGVGMVALATVNESTPDWVIATLLCQQGGFGLAIAANIVAGMNEVPESALAQGAALRTMTIQSAGAVSIAVFAALSAALIGSSTDPSSVQDGYNAIFVVTAAMLVVSCALALRLPAGARSAAAAGPVSRPRPRSARPG